MEASKYNLTLAYTYTGFQSFPNESVKSEYLAYLKNEYGAGWRTVAKEQFKVTMPDFCKYCIQAQVPLNKLQADDNEDISGYREFLNRYNSLNIRPDHIVTLPSMPDFIIDERDTADDEKRGITDSALGCGSKPYRFADEVLNGLRTKWDEFQNASPADQMELIAAINRDYHVGYLTISKCMFGNQSDLFNYMSRKQRLDAFIANFESTPEDVTVFENAVSAENNRDSTQECNNYGHAPDAEKSDILNKAMTGLCYERTSFDMEELSVLAGHIANMGNPVADLVVSASFTPSASVPEDRTVEERLNRATSFVSYQFDEINIEILTALERRLALAETVSVKVTVSTDHKKTI